MSLAYVTLTEAKAHLRVDFSDEDTAIELLIGAASSAVKNYLKSASVYEPERDEDDTPIYDSDGFPEIDEDSNTPRTVRLEVKQAVLILVGEWYKNRESAQDMIDPGHLPVPVMSLLYPLRDPALR